MPIVRLSNSRVYIDGKEGIVRSGIILQLRANPLDTVEIPEEEAIYGLKIPNVETWPSATFNPVSYRAVVIGKNGNLTTIIRKQLGDEEIAHSFTFQQYDKSQGHIELYVLWNGEIKDTRIWERVHEPNFREYKYDYRVKPDQIALDWLNLSLPIMPLIHGEIDLGIEDFYRKNGLMERLEDLSLEEYVLRRGRDDIKVLE